VLADTIDVPHRALRSVMYFYLSLTFLLFFSYWGALPCGLGKSPNLCVNLGVSGVQRGTWALHLTSTHSLTRPSQQKAVECGGRKGGVGWEPRLPRRSPLSPCPLFPCPRGELWVPLCSQLMAGRAAAAPPLPAFEEKGAIVRISQSESLKRTELSLAHGSFQGGRAAIRLHSENPRPLCAGGQPGGPAPRRLALYSVAYSNYRGLGTRCHLRGPARDCDKAKDPAGAAHQSRARSELTRRGLLPW
jgi:hypothetical protein